MKDKTIGFLDMDKDQNDYVTFVIRNDARNKAHYAVFKKVAEALETKNFEILVRYGEGNKKGRGFMSYHVELFGERYEGKTVYFPEYGHAYGSKPFSKKQVLDFVVKHIIRNNSVDKWFNTNYHQLRYSDSRCEYLIPYRTFFIECKLVSSGPHRRKLVKAGAGIRQANSALKRTKKELKRNSPKLDDIIKRCEEKLIAAKKDLASAKKYAKDVRNGKILARAEAACEEAHKNYKSIMQEWRNELRAKGSAYENRS